MEGIKAYEPGLLVGAAVAQPTRPSSARVRGRAARPQLCAQQRSHKLASSARAPTHGNAALPCPLAPQARCIKRGMCM